MYVNRPKFLDSPFFGTDENHNYILKPGAPPEVEREFKEYMDAQNDPIQDPETLPTKEDCIQFYYRKYGKMP